MNVVFRSVSLKYFPTRLRAMKELSRAEKGGFWFGFGSGTESGNGMIFVCKNQRSVKCLVIGERGEKMKENNGYFYGWWKV